MAKKKGKGILSKIFTTNQKTLGKWQIVLGILTFLFTSFAFYDNRFSFSLNAFTLFALYALITGYYNLKSAKRGKKK